MHGDSIPSTPPSGGLGAAVAAQGETIDTWIGPLDPRDAESRGYTSQGDAIDELPVNTLLFTQNQVVGIALGFDDVAQLHDGGGIRDVANRAIEAVRPFRDRSGSLQEAGPAKGIQLGALNASRWPALVDALRTQPLESVLSSHRNFGLSYDRVQRVRVHDRVVNSGLTFYLTDGSKMHFLSLRRDRLHEIAAYLRQLHIEVE
jgi:hypothetical protein